MSLTALLLVLAQLLTSTGAGPDADDERPGDALARLAVIGASATSGFGAYLAVPDGHRVRREQATFTLVVDATIREPRRPSSHHGNIFFFNSPMRTGPALLEQVLALDPTLVIGIDFLFWFGYGHLDRDGVAIQDEASRLALFEEGLALVARLECPVVVGDFPDMSPAVGKMLRPSQMPELATLAALNTRLAEWAAERENVFVVPLAKLVDDMRAGRAFRIGPHEWPAGSAEKLLQSDELHPTADGLIAMSLLVADALERRGVTPDEFLDTPEEVRERLKPKPGPTSRPEATSRPETPRRPVPAGADGGG